MNYVLKNQIRRLRIFLIPSAEKRSKVIKKKGLFAAMGENVFFQPRKLPADPKMIKFHNNIQIASDVTFVTHDIMHRVFSNCKPESSFYSHLGCIEIMDNVFIGTGSIILPNVKIGPNVIIAAGSVVTKDVMPGLVVGGVPAKPIGKFDDLMAKRENESKSIVTMDREKRIEEEWQKFYSSRS